MIEKYLEGKERIYYRMNEFSKRTTIVFVHGMSGSSSAWIPYEKHFENEFNMLSMDLRGHGKSFRPKKLSEYAIHKFSDDVYRVLKKEKIKDFVLIGHSFGNLVTLDFVKKHQKMLKALILVSADASPSKRKAAKIVFPFAKMSKLGDYLPGKRNGKHIDYSRYLGTGDWNIRRSIADISNTGMFSYLSSLHHAYDFDIEGFLPKIKVPTLIVHGEKDTIFPLDSARRIAKSIKHAKFVVFKGADHIIVLNNFNGLSCEIDKFVRGLK